MLIQDVQDLPETQRTALLLREIDALSYEQIAEAMETTVPSVKSLLVRARVSLAEAAEARQMSCEWSALELGEVAEGLRRMSPPVRRHVKMCDRCGAFRKQLRETNKALAAVFPIGPLVLMKKFAARAPRHRTARAARPPPRAAWPAAPPRARPSAPAPRAEAPRRQRRDDRHQGRGRPRRRRARHRRRRRGPQRRQPAPRRHADIAAAQPQAPVTSAGAHLHARARRPPQAPHTRTRVVSQPVRAPKKDPVDSKVAADKVAKATQPDAGDRPDRAGADTTATDAAATTPTRPRPTRPRPRPRATPPRFRPRPRRRPRRRRRRRRRTAPTTTTPAPPPPTTVPPDVPLPSRPRRRPTSGGAPPPDDGGSPPPIADARRPAASDRRLPRRRGEAVLGTANPEDTGRVARSPSAIRSPGCDVVVRAQQHDALGVVERAQHQHLGADRPDLARREVHDADDQPPLERLARVVGDLRRGALDPDLGPEVDRELPGRACAPRGSRRPRRRARRACRRAGSPRT